MNFADNKKWPLALGAAMLGILAFLLMRNHGLHPFVFLDELAYSTFARLVPPAQATVPSWLYLWLYGSTNACGPDFLECARGINAVLFVASGPLIYQCARKVTSPLAATVVTLFALLAPVNSYTAYFMPEAMYYFMFWLVTWAVLTRTAMHWAGHAALVGVLAGLMAMVKLHGLFLLPSLAVFLAFQRWQGGGRWVLPALAAPVLMLAAAMAVKYGVGYLLAGDAALSLFGTLYGAHATGTSGMMVKRLTEAMLNGRGHLMGVLILFALPIVVVLVQALSGKERAQAAPEQKALHLYAFLALAAPLAVTVLYTASIYAIEGQRIHMRYYDFAFPLLCMIAAAAMQPGPASAPRWLRVVAGGLFAGAVAYSVKHLLLDFRLSYVDGPEIMAMDITITGYLTIAAVALWALVSRRLGAGLFVFICLPVYLWHAAPKMEFFLAQMKNPASFDTAGKYARDRLQAPQRKDLAIAGTELSQLMRAKFYLDEPDIPLINLPEGAPLEATAVPIKKKWLLVVGKHALPAGFEVVHQTPEFALLKVERVHRTMALVRFGSEGEPGAELEHVEGMGNPEPWGRWSLGKEVKVRFKSALPKVLNLVVTAQTYGPNDNQPIVTRIGGMERSFKAPTTPLESLLQFQTDGTQREITFIVPQPISPHDLGHSVDTRKLGLGLISIEIGTAE
jgi:phosphoglycerol transferase